MKTTLPATIKTIEEAQDFLRQLHLNKEEFHPEDDPRSIVWGIPVSKQEQNKLKKLMDDIYNLDGNKDQYPNLKFDPCEFLLELDLDYIARMDDGFMGKPIEVIDIRDGNIPDKIAYISDDDLDNPKDPVEFVLLLTAGEQKFWVLRHASAKYSTVVFAESSYGTLKEAMELIEKEVN